MPDSRFFKNAGPLSLRAIAEKIGAEVRNLEGDLQIRDVCTLEVGESGKITFLTNAKYARHLADSKASACIIEASSASDAPSHMALLVHPNAHEAYAIVAGMLYPDEPKKAQVSSKASVAASAKIGSNVNISDFAVIGENVVLGDNCDIGANTYIGDNCEIGAGTVIGGNCTIVFTKIGVHGFIYPGARIGQDGFGFAKTSKGMMKVKQLGRVIIGNYVEVGANSCIDRGAIEDTIIGDGSKIDNLVQVGHNTIIGRSCVICGQTGLAGSTKVEDFVMLGGGVGVAGHLTIGTGSMIAAGSGLMADVAPKSVMGGRPAVPIRDWHKSNAMLKKLIKRDKPGKDE